MSKLNETDIQGFVLRGYNLPVARYLFLHFEDASARAQPDRSPAQPCNHRPALGRRQAAEHGEHRLYPSRPRSIWNCRTPRCSAFPVEFQQGMKHRAAILGDTRRECPRALGRGLARRPRPRLARHQRPHAGGARRPLRGHPVTAIEETGGASMLASQDAAAEVIDGKPTTSEHFGYTDGFGNPDYLGVERSSQPGQGKLLPNGTWAPARYRRTAARLRGRSRRTARRSRAAPSRQQWNLHGLSQAAPESSQPFATFSSNRQRSMQAAKKNSPPNSSAAGETERRSSFPPTIPIPPSSRIRTATPTSPMAPMRRARAAPSARTSAAFIRATPSASTASSSTVAALRAADFPTDVSLPKAQPVSDTEERGVIFMVLNASLSRQFEFVQQQWIQYGNDSHLGNDKDILMGNHGGHGRFVVQGDASPTNPPFVCSNLPDFVELRGGDYFFLPSITALGMIAMGLVDPR